MDIVVNFLLQFYCICFLYVQGQLVCSKPFIHLKKESSKFLPEITTLVSSANIIGTDVVLRAEGRSFIQIMKSKGPKIGPSGTQCFAESRFA
jgi:hypothetical protein